VIVGAMFRFFAGFCYPFPAVNSLRPARFAGWPWVLTIATLFGWVLCTATPIIDTNSALPQVRQKMGIYVVSYASLPLSVCARHSEQFDTITVWQNRFVPCHQTRSCP